MRTIGGMALSPGRGMLAPEGRAGTGRRALDHARAAAGAVRRSLAAGRETLPCRCLRRADGWRLSPWLWM